MGRWVFVFIGVVRRRGKQSAILLLVPSALLLRAGVLPRISRLLRPRRVLLLLCVRTSVLKPAMR